MEQADLKDIIKRANEIVGMTIGDLTNNIGTNFKDKGAIGNLIQVHGFFIKKNNDAEPDFKKEKIELKIVPLEKYKAKDAFKIKERTKVCSINYMNLIHQRWSSSHAKAKLNRVLFIFYDYNREKPFSSEIKRHFFYELNDNSADEIILKDDWEKIKNEVFKGDAYLLSEKLTKVLAASRSGAGGGKDLVDQPNNPSVFKALKRSFTLKPFFTKVIWNELNKKEYDSLHEKYEFNSIKGIEKILIEKVNGFVGKSLFKIAKEYNVDVKNGKAAAASLLRAALGFKGKFKPIKELEQLGLTVKMVPVNSKNGTPWEATSFPYQPLGEIAEEKNFDESELIEHLQGIIFIPVYRATRTRKSLKDEIVGTPFIWRPNERELKTIKKEWESYRSTIRNGVTTERVHNNTKKGHKVVNNLPNESTTEIIHIRPHTNTSYDLDPSMPPELELCKQSFWLNKQFVKQLIANNK